MKVHSRLPAAALACWALGFSRQARAADATEPIRIEYRAEAGCPSADDFSDQVFRRTASARLATGGELARTFVVSIERRGSSLVGSLVVRQADGTTESREVAGPECVEVAKVLALATALAIDPEASLAPNPEPRPAPAPAPPPPKPESPPSPPNEPSGSVSARAPWFLALGAALEGGVTPRLAYGGSLGGGWRAPRGNGPVSSAGLELTYLLSPPHAVETATTSFEFFYARPKICTFALSWSEDSGIAPCLSGEIGAVRGRGSDIAHGSTRSRVWAAVDPALSAHQALDETWFVEADASLVLPITRYHYVFRDPTTHIYSVPSVAVAFALSVGARLW